MNIEELKQLGLTEKESQTYLALLNMEETPVSQIAKKTQINRSLMYLVLDSLLEKGLATYVIKNNLRYYRAADPNKIISLLEEKQNIAKQILPDLLKLYAPRTKKPIVEILEGKEGIYTLFNDILNQNKEWCAFNVPGKIPDIVKIRATQFDIERSKKGIILKAILARKEKGSEGSKRFTSKKHSYVKFTNEEYDSIASTWIYSDRVAMVFWYSEFPFAVRIIDKKFSENYKKSFKLMWGNAKK
jgi:sugar-specific transcriptional regulator TrmB